MPADGSGRTRIAVPHLRAWRLKRLYSQDELADMSGVSKSTIVRLESGSSAILSTIGRLAKALDVSREELAYEEPERRLERKRAPRVRRAARW
jgi:transcriptional regulator with XRE-family HTH domain